MWFKFIIEIIYYNIIDTVIINKDEFNFMSFNNCSSPEQDFLNGDSSDENILF